MTCKEIMEFRNRSDSFDAFVGIVTTELEIGYAKGELTVTPHHENVIHSVHGGCLFTLADTIGGAAAVSRGSKVTTISGDFHFLSPGIGVEKLVAVATEQKYGKKISVYDVSIYDEKEKLLAKGTFSYFNLGVPLLEQ